MTGNHTETGYKDHSANFYLFPEPFQNPCVLSEKHFVPVHSLHQTILHIIFTSCPQH